MNDDSENHQLFFKLNVAQRVLMKAVDREMREKIGVSATQGASLLYLEQNDGCLLVDLSRELLQNKSAITTLIERMKKNELISKVPSPTDKRASQLFLTQKGKELCHQSRPFVTSYNHIITENFKADELEVVARFLNTIIDTFATTPENFFRR
jgi:DNA-binding MarR family transcriptional regulator